ncbi:MAG: YbhB/YbcL family Raf kinase inhibitor-like protein [Elusimicrobia bacterium]|nr:YbhB/YbcL family Raf kinase inhibitor-like protein [Elusimicrobiota bacterium]
MKNTAFMVFAAAVFVSCQPAHTDRPAAVPGVPAFTLFSEDVKDGDALDAVFTCDGKNVPPGLKWSGEPEGTKSFALILEDPDAPMGNFTHWIVVDIPAGVHSLERAGKFPAPSRELKNSFGESGYGGPCPPSGTHRYIFTLYALSAARLEGSQPSIPKLMLAKAALTSRYARR